MKVKKLTDDEIRVKHKLLYMHLDQSLIINSQEKRDEFLIASIRLLTEKAEKECPCCNHKFYC